MALMPTPTAVPIGLASTRTRLDRSAIGWATYQGFRDPYMGLVGGFIFMPYFATVLVPDPVAGQQAVATIGQITGLIVAVAAPLLGASIDAIGPRKPLLAVCTMLLAPLIACLWFAAPGGAMLSITSIMVILIATGVLFSMSEVVFASMLPLSVSPAQLSRASGLALSLGNLTSFLLTLFMLWGFALPGVASGFGIPDRPLFGLDPTTHETSRIVGPVIALSFAVGAIPLFVFARDAALPPTDGARSRIGEAVRGLTAIFRDARHYRDVMTYIFVRTVSHDAGLVLLTIGGVFAAGVMGWGATEMLIYGLLATAGGIAAGFIAGVLDERLGPNYALRIEIVGTLVCLLGLLGTSPTQILYLWGFPTGAVPRLWDAPVFATAPEVVFMAVALLGLVFQIAAWSSARTLLVTLAPPDKVGSFFGLAAFAAATTGWIGPLLVGLFTRTFDSQQAGMIPIAVLLAIGAGGLFLVKGGRTPTRN